MQTQATAAAPAPKMDPRQRESYVFQTDEEIMSSWLYKAQSQVVNAAANLFHGFSVEGLDNLPSPETPALFVSIHTSHVADCMMSAMAFPRFTGKLVRILLDRGSYYAMKPIMQRLGFVAGERDTAVELLKDGHWVAVAPGGAEEICEHLTARGSNAYGLHWESINGKERTGFAEVVRSAGEQVVVVPCFVDNGEEMRWCPVLDLWCALRLDVLYGTVMRTSPPALMWFLSKFWKLFWFVAVHFSIPVPVKATAVLGPPLKMESSETPSAFARRVRQSLQQLIDSRRLSRARAYGDALRELWSSDRNARKKQ